jgi:hypothetical protein
MSPAYGYAYNENEEAVGTVSENCFRVDDEEAYECRGQLELNAYDGYLSWGGFYPNDDIGGQYVIVGGTEDFANAKGLVTSDYDSTTGLSIRFITFE